MPDQVPTTPAGIPGVGANEDERLKGALAYILGFVTGIIVLLICENNKFLKFHAWQSIVYSTIIIVIAIIVGIVTSILSIVTFGLACCITWIPYIILLLMGLYAWYGAYLVYTGKPFNIPYVTEFVEKNLMK